jgi:hypothetical protein
MVTVAGNPWATAIHGFTGGNPYFKGRNKSTTWIDIIRI